MESVNGNTLPAKGKVHCFRQPLMESNGQDRQGAKSCVSVYFVPVERR